jgi:hypothetical protein
LANLIAAAGARRWCIRSVLLLSALFTSGCCFWMTESDGNATGSNPVPLTTHLCCGMTCQGVISTMGYPTEIQSIDGDTQTWKYEYSSRDDNTTTVFLFYESECHHIHNFQAVLTLQRDCADKTKMVLTKWETQPPIQGGKQCPSDCKKGK